MDTKVTLSFDEEVIKKAKAYASAQGISLSRLTEILYRRIAENEYSSIEDLPVADWVNMVAEGQAEYKPKKKTSLKQDYYESRKK
ncbi:DUF6364 family protein [Marinoscillum sp.]|uniref:DUF6364 family protein n=1 Tax=Marinoscillum sp. TaxID=2024838 RepID=UPI003BAABDC6